VVDLLVESEAR